MSPSPMFAEAAVLILKLSLWCALPFLLRPLLARSSASTRHLLLTLTLAGAVVLPLLRVAAPAWQAPAWLRLPELAPARDVAVGPTTPDLQSTERMAGRARPGVLTVEPGHRAFANPAPEPVGAARAPAGPERPAVSAPGRQAALHWLVWIWLAGSAAAMFRTARVVLRTRRVVRQAAPLDEPRALAAMSHARARLHIATEPELRQSRRFPVPFAWRGLRSVVVLPPTWRRWSDERLTVVLIHELAHLSRRDASALWIGRAATALWWFHPLVRRLEGWARRECERAADDAVLLSGSRASAYAEHLIAISRALARPFPAGVTLMMSNSPDLKHRLLAILHPDQPRRALSRRLAAGASLLALAFAVVLAGARFTPAAYAQEPEPAETQIDVHHRHHGDHHDDSDSDSGAGHDEWEKAYDAHRAGRYEEAVAAFEAATAAGFRPAVSTYNAGCGLSLSGRSDEALAALRRAIDLGLDDPELLAEDSDLDPLRSDARFQALVDDAFERAGERRDPIEHYRYRHAQEALQVLRESASEDAGAWSKVGTRLLMLRQLDAAAEALENAARFARESPATALYNLACAYALDGRPGDALGALERSIEAGYSDPDHMREDPDLRSLRGEAEFERLVDLADALDLDRFQRGFWHGHGKDKDKHKDKHGRGRDSRYSAERWAPAVDFYRGFVDEHPSLGAGWFNFAMALHYSERFDESVDAFRRAGELGFRPATSTYNVACGLSMQKRVDEALAALEEAIELGFHGGDLEDDSDLDNLRSDPRFRSLLLEMKLDRHG